ncbi:hypothetical protein ATO7_15198 [Oceanococcus atlanticus]|uniref:SURF1-like protein n=1 Tax=Oceanococcus atlanticus TaxID=1317117 RepID=A0A1Y1SAY3_9GAMM|nr:SURF1 family protein [Oceanococcus atlanticus]ORE85580.1 hypothetical protein ATO7_15198 [Oceanococcus atlanticus]
MRFRPPVWATLLTTFAVVLFGSLSWWQMQRGQEKAEIIARQGNHSDAVVDVARTQTLPAHGRRVELRGHWLADEEVLLDNKTHNKRIGVEVWTPLRLSGSDHLILINRGWVPAPLRRDELPDTGQLPGEQVTLQGYWRSLPRAGLATDDGRCDASMSGWPQRLNYPSHALLECLYQRPVANGIVLLDPQADGGFVREWTDLGIPPERHYGYAFQWASLMLTALILYIILNYRRSSP